jgi:hypothetical protein
MRPIVTAACWVVIALAPAACGGPAGQPTPQPAVETFSWPAYHDVVPPDERVAPKRPFMSDMPPAPSLPRPAAMSMTPSPIPPEGGFAPGLPPGPVTNYGTGGMQQIPGAPPNPPYPPGGLTH